MIVDTDTIISMTEADQNFSKVAELVDKYGSALIVKNDAPRYLVVDIRQTESARTVSDDDVLRVSEKLINCNRAVYEELAK